jgi:hypothetical protein
MIPDKKKAVSVIVAGIKPKKSEPKEEGGSADFVDKGDDEDEGGLPEVDPGLEAAADDVLAAIEGKDAATLAQALKDFFYLCQE